MEKYTWLSILMIIISLCAAGVFAAGTTISGTDITPDTVQASAADVGILDITITDDGSGFGDVLNAVVVNSQNTNDADVSAVKLYLDDDGDGVFEPGTDDTTMLSTVFAGGVAIFNPIGWVIPNSATVHVFVAYDVAAGAVNGNTLDARIDPNSILQAVAGLNANTIDPAGVSTVDTVAPSLAEITPVATPTNDNTPDYTFITTEAGAISYAGGCSSAAAAAAVGVNTITFNLLADGNYGACTITVTDAAGNPSAPLAVSPFTVDTVAPTLAEFTPVTTPTNDNTPNYIFSSDEAGAIAYAGGCSSATVAAVAGNNPITFNLLADGTYAACTITVTDAAGNPSAPLAVSPFTVDTVAPIGTLSVDSDPIYEGDLTQLVTVIYNEAMDPLSTPTITFTGAVGATASQGNGAWSLGNTVWTETFNVADANEETIGVAVSSSLATDVAGNAEGASVQAAFNIDTLQATVTNVGVNDALLTEADAGLGNFIVTIDYSEAMNPGVNPTIVFQNPADAGTLTGCAGGWTDADTYTYTCDVTDTDTEVANVDIRVTGAQDIAGNTQVAYTEVNEFSIDTLQPIVTSVGVNDNLLTEADVGAGNFIVSVFYNEAMNGAVNPTIQFLNPATAGTLAGCAGVWSTPTIYTYTCNVVDTNAEINNVDIQVTNAQDLAGNIQVGDGEIDVFDIDTLQPTVTNVGINDVLLTEADVGAGNFIVTVDYSEAMNGVNPSIQFLNPATAGTLAGCAGVWTDADTYTYTCNVVDVNIEADDVDIQVTGAQDTAGNTQVAYTEADAFSIDTFQPVVSNVGVNDILLTEADVGAGNFVVTVDYSEAMNGVNPTITFLNPADAGTLTGCAGVWADADTYTYTCNVVDADVEVNDVDIQVAGAQDAAGNTQIASTSQNRFDIDTLQPTVTNVGVNDNILTEIDVGGNFVVTVVYSEAMDGAVNPVIQFLNPSDSGTLTGCAGVWTAANTYTYTCTIADTDAEVGDIDIQVTGAQDVAGNTQIAYTETDKFEIDTRAPGITDMTGGFPTTGDQFRIWGIAVDSSQIQTIQITLNGDVATPPTANVDPLPASNANFEYLVDVNADGIAFDYTITVTDTYGNIATIGPMNMNIVDNDNPSVVINLPVPGYYNTIVPADVTVTDNIGVQYVKGLLEGGSNYEIFLNNAGTWQGSFDIAAMGIADGIYTFRADAYDPSSNQNNTETVAGIVVDTTPPAMNSLTSNITNNITRTDVDVTFTLDVFELYMDTVTLNGQAMNLVGGNIYNYIGTPASLGCIGNPAGDCTVTATATDLAGNVATIDYTFKVDDVLPVITIQPEDPIPAYNDDDVNISAIVFDSNVQIVEVTEDSTGADVTHNLGDNGADTYYYVIPAANLENQETVTYTFRVVDDAGNENTATATFTVQNRPPVFNGTIPDITVLEEQAIPGFNVVGYFSDPDFDVLTYSFNAISVDPEVIITVDPVTGDVSFSITDADYFGVNTFTISAADPYGGVATSNVVTLTVINVNDPPRLIDPAIALPDLVIPEDTTGSIPDLDAYFYDPDGDAFDYTVITDEPLLGAEITAGRGVLVTPAPDYYGVSNVHIFANDYLGGIGSDTFQVNVTPVDDAPVINDTALTDPNILNLTFMEDFGTYTFDLTPYESDADPYDTDPNLVWTVSGVDPALVTIAIDPVTDVMTITSVANAFGSDTFTLTLTDSTGLTDTLDLTVDVLPENDAPYIDPAVPSPLVTTEDVPVALDLGNYENDVDNTDAELVWTITGVDTSLFTVNAVDPITDMLIVTPVANQVGSDTITLTLTDPSGLFDQQDIVVQINPQNDAPIILNVPNATAEQGVLYVYEMEAVDVETDPLTIFNVNDTRFTVTGNRFTWVPTQADVDQGVVDVEFSVTDGDGLTTSITASITVNNVNDAPVITPIPDQTISEDLPFHYSVIATDPDNDTLTYSLSIRPDESMYIDPNIGVIGWLPLNQHVGDNVIEVTVCDDQAQSNSCTTETFILTVTNTNDQPFFDPALVDQTAEEDVVFQYDIDAVDVDIGDVISFSSPDIVALGGSIDPVTGLLTWMPQNQHVGDNVVEVTVCDDQAQPNSCFTDSFTITVTNANDAPVIANIPTPQVATQDILFTYDVIANDPDGDTITYDILQGPAGLVIDSATGTISWIPQNEDTEIFVPAPGHLVEVEASDGIEVATEQFYILVTNVNDAPVILSNAPTTATQGVAYIYEMEAEDPDLDPLTYTVDNPGFVVVDNIYTWIPTQADVDAGSVTVTFTVTDPFGEEDTETVTILIDNTNDAPVPLAFTPNPLILDEDVSYVISLTPFETDVDNTNEELTWTVTTADPDAFATLEIAQDFIDDILMIQGAQDYTGTVFIELTLCDIGGLCTPMAAPVEVQINPVNDAPEAPVLVLPEDASLVYSSSVQLQWLASADVDGNVAAYHVFFGNDSANLVEIASTADLYYYTIVEDEETYYWYVTAEDNDGAVSAPSETWSFTTSLMNAPVITDYTPADLNVVMSEGDSQEFTFTAIDVNVPPQALSYAWLLDGVEQDSGLGGSGAYTFATDYTSAGSYVVTLIVNNTYGLTTELVWNVQVDNLNLPPEFNGLPTLYDDVVEDEDYIVDLSGYVSDPDEDSANLAVYTDSEYEFTTAGQTIGLRFPQGGTYNITVIVEDSEGATAEQVVQFVVAEVNDAPIIDSYSPLDDPVVVRYDSSADFEVTASDPEGQPLTITWYQDGVEVGTGAAFTYVGDGETGRYDIVISAVVSDGELEAAQEWNLIQISYPLAETFDGSETTDFANEPDLTMVSPLILHREGYGMIIWEGPIDVSDIVTFDGLVLIERGAVAVDLDELSVLDGEPATVILEGLSYTATPVIYYDSGFTTDPADFNSICDLAADPACEITGYDQPPTTDGEVTFDVEYTTSFMVESNSEPEFTSNPVTQVYIDEDYEYDADAVDDDGDAITYSLVDSPAGMTIDSITGLITWTPSDYVDEHVEVMATDARGATATQSFTIDVVERPKLSIKDIEVRVDGEKDSSLDNGDTISEEAKPGDSVSFEIEVANDYTDDDDITIEDVQVTVTIKDIDDGDDIDEDSDTEDIDADSDETFNVELDLPNDAEEDTYDVEIYIEGEDENGNEHTIVWDLSLEVKREKHKIIIKEASLLPSVVSCGRDSSINVRVQNIGRDDEDEVAVRVENYELGIDLLEDYIELDNDVDDDDSEFSKTFALDVDSSVTPGTYPITVTAYYDTTKVSESRTVELNVGECFETGTHREDQPEYGLGDEDSDVVVTIEPRQGSSDYYTLKPLSTTGGTATRGTVTVTGEEVPFSESEEYIVFLIAVMILLLGIGIFMIGYLALKK